MSQEISQAQELAAQAAGAAARLRVGTWESVQALALVSIAMSLAEEKSQRPT